MIDPAEVDWSQMDDAEVWHAAQSGIEQAIEEAHRRGLDQPTG